MQQPIQEQPVLGFWRGVRDMLPLSVAVIPWGILAGSAAVNAGLSTLQAAGMSVLVFAGAAGQFKHGHGRRFNFQHCDDNIFSDQPAFCLCAEPAQRRRGMAFNEKALPRFSADG